MSPPQDASSPLPWPPVVTAVLLVGGAVLTWLAPLPLPDAFGGGLVRGFGFGGIVAALVLGGTAMRGFLAAGTPIPPNRPTRAIVASGVYAFTRNPMYLGMALLLFGIGLAASSWWFVIAAAIAVIALTKLAIEREEAYLERKFGGEYLAYKARVRRWL